METETPDKSKSRGLLKTSVGILPIISSGPLIFPILQHPCLPLRLELYFLDSLTSQLPLKPYENTHQWLLWPHRTNGSQRPARPWRARHRILDAQSSPFNHENFMGITANFSDTAALSHACDGVDAILHLGAFMSWKRENQQKIFDANVSGTLNVLSVAVASGTKKLVFASSGEVYPDRNPQYLPIDEKHPKDPTSPYGLSKLMAEEVVRFYERVHHLPSVILRFSHTGCIGTARG